MSCRVPDSKCALMYFWLKCPCLEQNHVCMYWGGYNLRITPILLWEKPDTLWTRCAHVFSVQIFVYIFPNIFLLTAVDFPTRQPLFRICNYCPFSSTSLKKYANFAKALVQITRNNNCSKLKLPGSRTQTNPYKNVFFFKSIFLSNPTKFPWNALSNFFSWEPKRIFAVEPLPGL